MENNVIENNEPKSFELSRCHGNSFIIWAFEVSSRSDLQLALSDFQLRQIPILLRDTSLLDEPMHFSNADPGELICLSPQGKVVEIISADIHGTASRSRRAASILFARKGFAALFGVEADRSLLMTSIDGGYLFRKLPPCKVKPENLSGDQLAALMASESTGLGLRSSIPYVYVWYNQLLFVVSRMGFPDFNVAASIKPNVLEAVQRLNELGFVAVLRDAVYFNTYKNNLDGINVFDTWWGMENAGKFK